jgi:ABC-type transport system involved in multi-copper enzyme maturation permease subunit
MRALLRADWLRFRRRRDFWLIAIGVLVIGGVSFIGSYRSESTDPPWPTEEQLRQDVIANSAFEGMTQAEVDAQVDQFVAEEMAMYESQKEEFERNQQLLLQKYDVVQAPFTIIGGALAPLLAIILIASFAIGDEFRFGTLRTSLLAANDRRRFLGARLASLLALIVTVFVALAVVGIVLALLLRLTGAEVVETVEPIDPAAGLGWFGAQILVASVVVVLAVTITLLLRTGALSLPLVALLAVTELFIGNLPIFARDQPLAGVPIAFLTVNARALTVRLGLDSHAVALAAGEPPTLPISLPLVATVAIIAAWGLFFLVVAERRLQTMDIVE